MRSLLILTILLAAGSWAATLAAAPSAMTIADDEIFGADPALPPPAKSWIPTVKIANAVGWASGQSPQAAEGLSVSAFASGLDHPRWLYLLPNGDVLVAESNRPPKETKGVKEWIMGLVMSKAGAGAESANRITLLSDRDGDGMAEKTPFITGLNSPFGMALIGENLYVANTDAIVRFKYAPGATSITTAPEIVAKLPAGPRNHHWTKNIVASADGSRLYVTIGSNSNVGENGMAEEEGRAAIWEVDVRTGQTTGQTKSYATGLRNPNGMDFEPETGELWTVVNERDELGDNLVPDYLTSVKPGAFYGWPYAYFGKNIDTRVALPEPGLIATAIAPDYAVGAHTASLGLAFSDGKTLSDAFASGAFIGQHGSWNRTPPAGYRVIFVPFTGGKPNGKPMVVLGGFLNEAGEALGRPVAVILDKRGGLLVADDVGNTIWRVRGAGVGTAQR